MKFKLPYKTHPMSHRKLENGDVQIVLQENKIPCRIEKVEISSQSKLNSTVNQNKINEQLD